MTDSTNGDNMVWTVRPAPGRQIDDAELFAFARQHLAPHKTPTQIIYLDEFPLAGSGKIQKYVLRQRWEKWHRESLGH